MQLLALTWNELPNNDSVLEARWFQKLKRRSLPPARNSARAVTAGHTVHSYQGGSHVIARMRCDGCQIQVAHPLGCACLQNQSGWYLASQSTGNDCHISVRRANNDCAVPCFGSRLSMQQNSRVSLFVRTFQLLHMKPLNWIAITRTRAKQPALLTRGDEKGVATNFKGAYFPRCHSSTRNVTTAVLLLLKCRALLHCFGHLVELPAIANRNTSAPGHRGVAQGVVRRVRF